MPEYDQVSMPPEHSPHKYIEPNFARILDEAKGQNVMIEKTAHAEINASSWETSTKLSIEIRRGIDFASKHTAELI